MHKKLQIETNGLSMHISRLVYCTINDQWHKSNARESYVRIYYVQSGHGIAQMQYRGKQVFLKPGNIYIIPPNLKYGYSCEGSFSKLFCHFTMLRYDNYDFFSSIDDIIVLENRMNTVNNVIDVFLRNDALSSIQLKSIFYQTAYEALVQANACENISCEYSPLIQNTIDIINRERRIDITSQHLAKQLLVSPSTLQKNFKKEMGKSLGRYIKESVMLSTEIDLRTTNLSMKDIADKHGFCDQFYFSRVFKKLYMITPSEYRNAHKNEI